ncbi:hypothetical protein T12_15488 [Trichinella patagoniensis]|uniref:Uncharacterized protein n=1 Tax=Trichinella patagoniensis TaxID=990121 RepID=A0A0V0ZSM1_9BILA|nr:hypothetical protein T12_15488 [Trichinella patagoniensis]
MSFASSFNILGQFSSNKKANTHTQNAHESCEFQKGKKQTHFYRWRGPQSFQQRKCSQSDSISKQQSLVKTALLLAVTIASFGWFSSFLLTFRKTMLIWNGAARIFFRRDIDRDALMKDATLKCGIQLVKEVKIAQESVDASRGDI